ncbi:MAG: 6-carboxytetrahydropterin synthase QueD [Cycloclasticus sp.]|nr:MAG: 6-pyruvoyl tetrahydrobiopterin synthase [Cycloclasticus sp. Phe_18]MBV1913151.1 6-carboxytetrahydropterin synthase QueD [Cycloclasticus sp.]MDF1689560.1 6-carboxytetrahydropterin synthase QueD [Cycloclasticus sp.]MEE4290725.1 6-carboxytetrahydropterin synthase QueD [Cycloclasticus sp.]
MYRITKNLSFCYGHRLMNHPGKCRHLHGHSARVAITLESNELNDQGMVCDFSDIKQFVGEWINKTLDHNLLLHKNDPVLPLLQEAGERLMVVDEHPTAEFLAKLIYDYVAQGGFPVVDVSVWETDSANASYSTR